MKKRWIGPYGVIIVVAVFMYSLFFATHKKRIESEARTSQRIDQTWIKTQDDTQRMVAMLFSHHNDNDEHIVSIYVKENDILQTYAFRFGGHCPWISESVGKFEVDNQVIYLSSNMPSIRKMIDVEDLSKEIAIDHQKPFVIIVPKERNIQFTNDQNERFDQDAIKTCN